MPFRAEELRQRFAAGIEQGRMGHSYLLTGDRAESLENLALGLAGQVLAAAPQEHPDFHSVRPESKSRHITVEQIRELERELYLRPFMAPLKVAVIFDAERMCLGSASAANAFLKTLEEPPAHTLILLTSGRPAMLLPTIISRCLRLDLGFEDIDAGAVHEPEWIRGWYARWPNPALRAYARAQALHEHWAGIRETAEAHLKDSDAEEDVAKALVEAEFQLGRQESIAQLQRWYWRRSEAVAAPAVGTTEKERLCAVKALEELQAGLAQNCEPHLAVEYACLRIEGLV
jgi:DNA polymerase-3 subunit delta'